MSGTMHLIVGLGNPGKRYEKTRHNIGAMILEKLLVSFHLELVSKPLQIAHVAQVNFHPDRTKEVSENQVKLIFLRPQSYMNLSGRPIAKGLQYYGISPQNMLVLHDEIDLPFGNMRMKQSGGHRGHNGLRDIISIVGPNFHRLRFGVGRPENKVDVADYVLSPFFKEETSELSELIEKAQSLCMEWIASPSPIVE